MDWAKAKTYVIIFLFVLNILLGIFNVLRMNKYNVESSVVKTTENILKKRGIELECDLPSDYVPMSNTELKRYSYDHLEFKNTFFSPNDNIHQTKEFNDNIFYSDNFEKKLTFTEDKVIFEAMTDNEETPDAVIEKTMNFIEKKYCVMKKVRDDKEDGIRNIVYSQQYNGYFIFNNSINFKFEDTNFYTIEFKYYSPLDFKGSLSEIYPPTEAVYKFSSEIGKIYDMPQYIITNMQIGYFYEKSNSSNESNCISKPYYRIYLKGIDEPFYINALNNEFLYETI